MNPSSDTLRSLLQSVCTIAVIGAKDTPTQPVDGVGRYLLQSGFAVIPVHPVRTGVWGLTTYASVRDIPAPVDIVVVFRAPQYCPGHAREVLGMKHRPVAFWMQLGIRSSEAASLMEDAGIVVVQDVCLKRELCRLFPRP